jgi:hypothetical protein
MKNISRRTRGAKAPPGPQDAASELHANLTRTARRLFPAAEVPDAVQEAVTEVLLRPHRGDDTKYGAGILRKRAARWHRDQSKGKGPNGQRADVLDLPERADDLLGDLEDLARLDAALEQLLVWGDTGSTNLGVRSLLSFEGDLIRREWHLHLELFNHLPLSQRQRARYKHYFLTRVRAALSKSSYTLRACEVEPPCEDESSPAEDDTAPVEDVGSDEGQSVPVLVLPTCILRPVLLVQRCVSSVTTEEALRIVYRAMEAAVEKYGPRHEDQD